PIQFQQSLIKRNDDESANLEGRLRDCVSATVHKSTVEAEQAAYTDISGAIALASQQAGGRANYLSIISDFEEDLPAGRKPVPLELHGERVLMLHRQGHVRHPLTVSEHL